jgi:acyl CoA:acetate/3-ketoacid CoA transferase beta subunit
MTSTRGDVCALACADLFATDGEILASPMAPTPMIGARLARLTHSPDLLLSDGEAYLLADTPPLGGASPIEGWIPYRRVFDVVAAGTRHVVMGANQIDRFGNQNISCFGPHDHPTRQMFGVRGGPGNTINHRTSYWVPKHSTRIFVPAVDMISGVGWDRVSGAAAQYLDVFRVVTNLAVLDFGGPGHAMRVLSVHPGVELDEVVTATGFELDTAGAAVTREPSADEVQLLDSLDPKGVRHKEVGA